MLYRLATFLLFAASAAAVNCPAPYTLLDQTRCILIDPYVAYTYAKATEYCNTHGGLLLTMNDCNTVALVYDFIHSEVGTINHNYWLGASDEKEEGTWKFVDSLAVPMGTPFWYPGEPNGGKGVNCAVLYSIYDHKWIDYSCSGSASPICIKKL